MIIKVCGMRDAENIREVAQLGVDALGVIFYPKSPRCVRDLTGMGQTLKRTDADMHIPRVGVFVNDTLENIVIQIIRYDLDVIQLHGDEKPEMAEDIKQALAEALDLLCSEVQKKQGLANKPQLEKTVQVCKAISVSSAEDIQKYKEYVGAVDFFLFDTKCESKGGSGQQFDWSVLDAYDGDVPFLLSGGIGPDDAERVKAFKHPLCFGIDINSKFEIEPGLKDVEKIKNFLEIVKKKNNNE